MPTCELCNQKYKSSDEWSCYYCHVHVCDCCASHVGAFTNSSIAVWVCSNCPPIEEAEREMSDRLYRYQQRLNQKYGVLLDD